MTALSAASTAFRESYLDADTLDLTGDADWNKFDARRLRYDLLDAYFQGNAYRTIHNWSKKMKADFGLYKYTRDIYNPSFRLGSFYRSHVWGGWLDMAAGDGVAEPSALPILTENENLRLALAQLWRDSNWKTARKLVPMGGAVRGDAIIQIIDDPERGKVYLKSIHPGVISGLDKDAYGNVKAYQIEYLRSDPNSTAKTAVYAERVTRDGDMVVYELLKDGHPYHWGNVDGDGNPIDTWGVPYGFVPMVHIKHFDLGLDWGMSELMPRLPLFREVDDQGSKLNDQIRKMVEAPALFAGVKAPDSNPSTTRTAPTATRPEIGREEAPAIYSTDPNAKVHFLVAPLDIEAVANKIKDDLELLEKDYPELALMRAIQGSGENVSGIALERLQLQAAEKVQDYRDTYDDALVRAQQMAVAIGGWRDYPGYGGFGLESYDQGVLTHEIARRPVFTPTTSQQIDYDQKRAQTAKTKVESGWPLLEVLRDADIDDAVIDRIAASPEYMARLAMVQMGLQAANGNNG